MSLPLCYNQKFKMQYKVCWTKNGIMKEKHVQSTIEYGKRFSQNFKINVYSLYLKSHANTGLQKDNYNVEFIFRKQ